MNGFRFASILLASMALIKHFSTLFLFLTACYTLGYGQVNVSGSTGADGTYTTVKGAFDQINLSAQSGNNIVISISGNTTETASAILNQSAGAWASLKITPSTTVTVGGNISGPLMSFNGADKVWVAGSNLLTFDNSGTSNQSSTIRFLNDACNNKIQDCFIKGSSTGDNSNVTYASVVWFYTGTSTGNDNDTIIGCDIGPSGANLPYMAVRGYGTSGKENDGIVIENNTIHDFFCTTSTTGTEGIYAGLYNNAWTIKSNKFYQSASRVFTGTSYEYRAIYITNTTLPGGDYTVSDNIIGYANSASAGTTTISGSSNMIRGIYIKTNAAASASAISNNTIASITQTTSRNGTTSTIGNSPFIAIAADGSAPVTISNNIIGAVSGTGSITVNHNHNSFVSTIPVIGIYTSGSAAHSVTGNSIGAVTLNKTGTLASLSFNGIRTEGNGAVSVSDNDIGNSTVSNITSNFPDGNISGIYLSTTSATITVNGNTIRNCKHSGNATSQIIGIDMNSASGVLDISDNTITELIYTNTNSVSPGYVVIGIASNTLGSAIFHITGNTIQGLHNTYSGPSSYSYIHGIYLVNTGTTGHTISSNSIYDLTVAKDGYVIGVLVFDAGYTFTNNMISIGYGLPASASIGCYAMYFLAYTYPGYFYYNTFVVGGTSSVGGNFNITMNASSLNVNSKLQNNIIMNKRSTPTPNNDQAVYIGVTSIAALTSDYNNLYVSGPAYIIKKVSSGYATLSAWQAAVSKDSHSISSDLSFNDIQYDLHLTSADCLIAGEQATPLAGISADIDNDSRDATIPTIGADECLLLLPVELKSFTADLEDNKVIIQWATASEINNDHYEIERSKDAITFEAIGSAKGNNFSSSESSYHFYDMNPITGISYYRLKQVDTDSTVHYSLIDIVENYTQTDFKFYPNPVSDYLHIVSSDDHNSHNIRIYNVHADLIESLLFTGEISIQTKEMIKGVYFLNIDGTSQKFIKQ